MSQHLPEIARRCRVTSSHRYIWFGQSFSVFGTSRQRPPEHHHRPYLLAGLTDRLYQDAYGKGRPTPAPPANETFTSVLDREFAQSLAHANAAVGGWEPGWTLRAIEEDKLCVDSGSLQLWVSAHEIQQRQPSIGSSVSIRMAPGSHDISPGYYSVFSDEPATRLRTSQQIIRLYFALTAHGAQQALFQLTTHLNRIGRPFRLKLLSQPHHYDRADAAVLYLAQENLPDFIDPLAAATAAIADSLRDVTPLFTQPLTAGVAFAEEPLGPHSFGQHRCRILANGLIDAPDQGWQARLQAMEQSWLNDGLSLDTPHLNSPASNALYTDLVEAFTTLRPRHLTSQNPISTSPRTDQPRATSQTRPLQSLATAQTIARQLTADAVWSNDRCTWLSLVPTTDHDGRPTLAYGTVGHDLYDGEAGIALFLAAAGQVLDDHHMRHTAQAAARQSVIAIPTIPGTGLYLGSSGIMMAAAIIARLTQDASLYDQVCHLAATTIAPDPLTSGPDLLMGGAGTILGLLTLSAVIDNPILVQQARDIGDRLLQTAHSSTRGLSWPIPGGGRGPNLTGLSHGASGIAVALGELALATGDTKFIQGCLQAIAYERTWYDADEHNWPDLRDTTNASEPHHFLSQWCHGTPGIALARLRLRQIIDDPALTVEATNALSHTLQTTRAAFDNHSLSYSLCHGIAGNLDILLDGVQLLDTAERHDLAGLINDFNDATTRHCDDDAPPWPCGVPAPGVQVPGLMLGTAGIGYHLLRAADVPLPSILLPRPAALVDLHPTPHGRVTTHLSSRSMQDA